MKKFLKIAAIIGITGILIGVGIGIYMYNMPHRDIQSANTDYYLKSSDIVSEYLADKHAANQKYLSANGESKILEITGPIAKISENYNGDKVILLKEAGDAAGVSATFTPETNKNTLGLSAGQIITIKGVIRSGASYDEDLELYEHVIIEKCDIIKNK